MSDSMLMLADIEGEMIPIIAIGGGLLVAVVAIIFGSLTKIARSRDVERSRREISAYIAEGTISPEEGERMMNAGPKIRDNCC